MAPAAWQDISRPAQIFPSRVPHFSLFWAQLRTSPRKEHWRKQGFGDVAKPLRGFFCFCSICRHQKGRRVNGQQQSFALKCCTKSRGQTSGLINIFGLDGSSPGFGLLAQFTKKLKGELEGARDPFGQRRQESSSVCGNTLLAGCSIHVNYLPAWKWEN